jgi:hypothetical protein
VVAFFSFQTGILGKKKIQLFNHLDDRVQKRKLINQKGWNVSIGTMVAQYFVEGFHDQNYWRSTFNKSLRSKDPRRHTKGMKNFGY